MQLTAPQNPQHPAPGENAFEGRWAMRTSPRHRPFGRVSAVEKAQSRCREQPGREGQASWAALPRGQSRPSGTRACYLPGWLGGWADKWAVTGEWREGRGLNPSGWTQERRVELQGTPWEDRSPSGQSQAGPRPSRPRLSCLCPHPGGWWAEAGTGHRGRPEGRGGRGSGALSLPAPGGC